MLSAEAKKREKTEKNTQIRLLNRRKQEEIIKSATQNHKTVTQNHESVAQNHETVSQNHETVTQI
jgi:hypothetical protein